MAALAGHSESTGTVGLHLVGSGPPAGGGGYKQSEYGKVILSFTVLRRLDCVLEPTKNKVLAEAKAKKAEPFPRRAAKVGFYNTSALTPPKLMGGQDHIRQNLNKYIEGFSPEVRNIFGKFEFEAQVERLAKAKLLYQVAEKFANIECSSHHGLLPKSTQNSGFARTASRKCPKRFQGEAMTDRTKIYKNQLFKATTPSTGWQSVTDE